MFDSDIMLRIRWQQLHLSTINFQIQFQKRWLSNGIKLLFFIMSATVAILKIGQTWMIRVLKTGMLSFSFSGRVFFKRCHKDVEVGAVGDTNDHGSCISRAKRWKSSSFISLMFLITSLLSIIDKSCCEEVSSVETTVNRFWFFT